MRWYVYQIKIGYTKEYKELVGKLIFQQKYSGKHHKEIGYIEELKKFGTLFRADFLFEIGHEPKSEEGKREIEEKLKEKEE